MEEDGHELTFETRHTITSDNLAKNLSKKKGYLLMHIKGTQGKHRKRCKEGSVNEN